MDKTRYKNTDIVAWAIVTIGALVLIIEVYLFQKYTTFINSAADLTGANLTLTSAIGSLIGGTVGIFFSLGSVLFFISALYSQREDIKVNQQLAQRQHIEQNFFNLLDNLLKIRERIYQNAQYFKTPPGALYGDPPKPRSKQDVKPDFESLFAAYQAYDNFYSPGNLQKIFIKVTMGKENSQIAGNDFESYGKWEEAAQGYYRVDVEQLNKEPRKESYRIFYREFGRIYDHYFRSLLQLLKFLKKNEELEVTCLYDSPPLVYEKYHEYSQFINCQMSTDELALLFYNSLLFPQMMDLLKYYKFLEVLNTDELIR